MGSVIVFDSFDYAWLGVFPFTLLFGFKVSGAVVRVGGAMGSVIVIMVVSFGHTLLGGFLFPLLSLHPCKLCLLLL
jgi:hypothetical protein